MKLYRHCVRLMALTEVVVSIACGHKRQNVKVARQPLPRPQPSISVPVGTAEQGMASWYGPPYHGRPAADGEVFDTEQLVAAHRTLPFNTWVKVTNLNNGRTVNVRIIDRGPFIDGRIIDLSKAAAREIQMLGPGIARVRVEVISAPPDTPSDDFYGVQVGAFSNHENAEKLRARYAERYGFAEIETKQGRTLLYRVVVGKRTTQAAAQQIADQLAPEIGHVFVIRLDPGHTAQVSDNPDSSNPAVSDTNARGVSSSSEKSVQP